MLMTRMRLPVWLLLDLEVISWSHVMRDGCVYPPPPPIQSFPASPAVYPLVSTQPTCVDYNAESNSRKEDTKLGSGPARPANMAPASIPPGPKANPNVVAAFFNSFMSAGEQKFTVVSSFFSSGLFLLALALVKQYSSLKELQDAHEGPPETQQQQQQLLQPLPQKQHLSQSLPQGRTGTLLTVDTKGSGLDRSRYGSNDHHQSRTSMTSLPTPAPSPPPSSSPFFSTMVGGNAQPTTPRSSSSVHTTTTMTTPSSTTAMPSKGKKKGSSSSSSNSSISGGGADVGGGGVALNDEFLRQLIRLVRKLIHSWKTREAACLGGMVFLLLARTACDLRMISLVVGAERAIVMGDRPSFRISLARFLR
ncbi:hypothetical protein VYU27_010146 [Nannochloropsis oceanica]